MSVPLFLIFTNTYKVRDAVVILCVIDTLDLDIMNKIHRCKRKFVYIFVKFAKKGCVT